MSQAKQGDTVKVHYKASSGDLIIFDSSNQVDPLKFTIGKEEILPAFEKALIGMNTGDKKTINIPSDEAFGPRLEELVTSISKAQLPKDLKVDVGQELQVMQPDGSAVFVTVVSQSDADITFDANHPLAGKDLKFDIHLVEII